MEQKKSNSTPIRLSKTDRIIPITRKKYVKSGILYAGQQIRTGEEILRVGLQVDTGIHKGLKLWTSFYDTYKSRLRLTHLCNAVGIFGELKSPDQLVGRRVKLRVVPTIRNNGGRTFMNYRITRFHPIDSE